MQKDLLKLTVAELRTMAKELGIEGISSLKKEELAAKVGEATASKSEKASAKGEKASAKGEKTSEKSEKTSAKSEKASEKSEKTPEKSEKTPEKVAEKAAKSEKSSEKSEKASAKGEKVIAKSEKTPEKSEKTSVKRKKTAVEGEDAEKMDSESAPTEKVSAEKASEKKASEKTTEDNKTAEKQEKDGKAGVRKTVKKTVTEAETETAQAAEKKPVKKPVKKSAKEEAKEEAKEPEKEPSKESVKEPLKESVKEPERESAKAPERESAKAPARESAKTPGMQNGQNGQQGQRQHNPGMQNGQNGQQGQRQYNPGMQNGQNGQQGQRQYNPGMQNGQNGQQGQRQYNPGMQNGQNGQQGQRQYNPGMQNGQRSQQNLRPPFQYQSEQRQSQPEQRQSQPEQRQNQPEQRQYQSEQRQYQSEQRQYQPEQRQYQPEQRQYQSEQQNQAGAQLQNNQTSSDGNQVATGTVNNMQSAGDERIQALDSGITKEGILEVMVEGFGFIRCDNFLPGDDDVYVSPAQIRKLNLKTGDFIVGNTKQKTGAEKFSALLYVKSINGFHPGDAVRRPKFEDLTPIFPNQRLHLETPGCGPAMRLVDLISPIGKGQRGMIVSQPKAGKTTLLKQIAKAIQKNHAEMHLIILLIDERPEEVTDMKESIVGDNVEIIYSTFDEMPENHKRVSEMVIERAKRLVEHGQDVIILLDSITRLARAYNLTVTASGRTLSGGLDPAALHMPKRFFGAARNMKEGGSLTILATALVETGSRMDDVVYEEFKGTGNMELVLDRSLSERRIFPAIDLPKSSTRREDLLLSQAEIEANFLMRRAFNSQRSDEAVERIIGMVTQTKSNAEFVAMLKRTRIL